MKKSGQKKRPVQIPLLTIKNDFYGGLCIRQFPQGSIHLANASTFGLENESIDTFFPTEFMQSLPDYAFFSEGWDWEELLQPILRRCTQEHFDMTWSELETQLTCGKTLTDPDFIQTLSEVMKGNIPSTRRLTEGLTEHIEKHKKTSALVDELETAFHEAGHAVVGAAEGYVPASISIRNKFLPAKTEDGHFYFDTSLGMVRVDLEKLHAEYKRHLERDDVRAMESFFRTEIRRQAAGQVAENAYLSLSTNPRSGSVSGDYDQAIEASKRLWVAENRLYNRPFPVIDEESSVMGLPRAILARVDEAWESGLREALRILAGYNNRFFFFNIIRGLGEKGELSQADIQEIFSLPVPPPRVLPIEQDTLFASEKVISLTIDGIPHLHLIIQKNGKPYADIYLCWREYTSAPADLKAFLHLNARARDWLFQHQKGSDSPHDCGWVFRENCVSQAK